MDAKRIVSLSSQVSYEFGESLGCAGITAIFLLNRLICIILLSRVIDNILFTIMAEVYHKNGLHLKQYVTIYLRKNTLACSATFIDKRLPLHTANQR
jgi:hypothetical protein